MQKAETWTTEIDFDMIATDKHLSLYDKELVGGQGCGPHLDKPSKPSSFLCQKKSGGLNKINGERLDLKKGILWIESYNTQKEGSWRWFVVASSSYLDNRSRRWI